MSNILLTNANLVLDGFAELQPSFNVLVKENYIHSVFVSPDQLELVGFVWTGFGFG